MRLIILSCVLFLINLGATGQNPVSWAFAAKKIKADFYEIQMTATIEKGWHLYSQDQPEDAIAIPTSFTFINNPLLTLNGKIREIGKLEKFHDKELDLSANQYSEKVVFVQQVSLKGKVKTSFNGSVEYQTCDDKKCLPPKTINFKISLD